MLAILNKDYDLFVRLDDKAKNRGENLLTKTQFNYICSVLDVIIEEIVDRKNGQKEKEKFLTLLLSLTVTHDYGIENPDDDAGHQFRSAQLCRPDLEKLNFSKEQIEFMELIIENHCYYGDLSLGEGTYNYYQVLLAELKQRVHSSLLWKKHFLAILWLLNILDINAATEGYLSKEKMEVIGELHSGKNFDKAITSKNLLKTKIAYINDNYAGREIDYTKIDPEFANIYLQHFIGFFNSADREGLAYLKEDEAVLLINKIVELFKATRQLKYKFITFKERGELGTKVIHNFVKKISGKGGIVILNEMQDAGLFYGIPFEIKNNSLFIRNDKISY